MKMNSFKKLYCRIFQGIFYIAIPFLPYRTPKVLDSVSEVPSVIKDKKLSHAFVVTDSFLAKSGATKPLLDSLAESGIRTTVFDEVLPNPTIDTVERARRMYVESGCDCLIAFGGGSSIDCAKGVGARIARPKKPLAKMRGILRILKKPPFTVAIPTTAGTGSETTVTIVLTEDETHEKYPISDLCLIPDVAVLDPEVTRTLPKHITASTGMDVLTHAVEAYIGNSVVKSTRKACFEATKLVIENIETAYNDGDNLTARKNMLRAAFCGGFAFSKSYVGYCHAVAHTLGGKYNIPHGVANATLLPYVLDAYGEKIHKKLRDLAVSGGICDETCDINEAAKLFKDKIRTLNKSMGIPEKLSGIRDADIPSLARVAEYEANPIYPVPVLMSAKELEYFYRVVAEDLK